nr:SAM-dependent methyltransferase [candidate division Zixibacteria bacterium]
MKNIQYRPIGIIHSPFKNEEKTPPQPGLSGKIGGIIVLQPDYKDGLSNLQKFPHIILVYHLHLSNDFTLKVKPSRRDSLHSVFTKRCRIVPIQSGCPWFILTALKITSYIFQTLTLWTRHPYWISNLSYRPWRSNTGQIWVGCRKCILTSKLN